MGLPLVDVAWTGIQLLTSRLVGDAKAIALWDASSSWTMAALPLFLWMGEILFRSRLPDAMLMGLAPWLELLPERLFPAKVTGCIIFAKASGSSAATRATFCKMTMPDLKKRGYFEEATIGTSAGAGILGQVNLPLMTRIVYAVTASFLIAKMFIAEVFLGRWLASLFMGCIAVWARLNPGKIPALIEKLSFALKVCASVSLIPLVALITLVPSSICSGIAAGTKAATLGVIGSLGISAAAYGALSKNRFLDSVMAPCRLYYMIALSVSGAAFVTLALRHMVLPRQLAQWTGRAILIPLVLIAAPMAFCIVLGSFLDGIWMVVITIGVIFLTVQKAAFHCRTAL